MPSKQQILSVLKTNKPQLRQLGVRQIGLFGSHVTNMASAKSDIDLLIDFDPAQEKFENFLLAVEQSEQLFDPSKVDVVTLNGSSKHFATHILLQVIYA